MKKKILVIGGSSGLGKQMARLYAADGCVVGIMARRGELLEEVQNEFPSLIRIQPGDISQPGLEEKLNGLIHAMGGMDVFIVAASIVEFNPELFVAPELATVHINVTGFTAAINYAWHYFTQQESGQIVGITSLAAVRGNKPAPAYNASKAFQSNYLEGLRLKAAAEKTNVTITELVPGYIDTAMAVGERIFWLASIKKAGAQAKKAIDRKKRRAFITKRWWWVFQIQRLMPSFLYYAIVNSSWRTKQKSKTD